MTGARGPIRDKVASGALVLLGARFASRAFDFVALVVIARYLTPADFGLVAIAMSVVQITETVLELPTGGALLQLKAISRTHMHTAFTLTLLRGMLLATILCAMAVPLASFFDDDRLIALICALSIAPAVRALKSPRNTLLFKHLLFRPDATAEIVGKAAACVIAISLAIATGSYWAIAAGSIASALFTSIASFVIVPMKPVLTLRHWRHFHHFLGWSMASQAISALNWQTDRVVLGKLATPAIVGLFATLRDLAALTYRVLLESIQRPLNAALARSNGQPARQREVFGTSLATILSIGIPVAAGQALLAPEIIGILLGPGWMRGVIVYQVVSFTLIAGIYSSLTTSLLFATGRPALVFNRNLYDLAFRIPVTVLAILAFGWLGAVWALLAADVFLAGLCMVVARRAIGIGIASQLSRAWRGAISAAFMAAGVWACREALPHGGQMVPMIAFLLTASGVGAAIYLTAHWICWHLAGRPNGIERLLADIVAGYWQGRGKLARAGSIR